MGQAEIINFLKKNKGKWVSTSEIGDALRLGTNSVSTSLRTLVRTNFVDLKCGYYWNHVHRKNQPINEYRLVKS